VVGKLNAALNAALATEDVRKRLALEGAEALPVSPTEHDADIAAEEAKWSAIIRKSGLKAE
jgi:tripartite-type tricarboxylate transporter receptor subunit TctC